MVILSGRVRRRGVSLGVVMIATLTTVGCRADAPSSNAMLSHQERSGYAPDTGPRPAVPPVPSSVDIDEEMLDAHRAQLEGHEPPGGWSGVPGRDTEWCMTELGWEVTANSDGTGVTYEGTAEQEVAMNTAFQACRDAIAFDINDLLNEDFLSLRYEDRLQVAHCLREAGYTVTDPPSREVFIEQRLQGHGPAWDPIGDIPDSQLYDAMQGCPSTPFWELQSQLDP